MTKILEKKEIVFFNKSDLVEPDIVNEKLKEFSSKVKIKFEIISTLSNKDILKVKKTLIKNVN